MTPEQFVELLDTTIERTYHSNGQLGSEEYYVDGKLHRLDGPAYTFWNRDGQLDFERYYINGNRFTKEEFENDTRTIC